MQSDSQDRISIPPAWVPPRKRGRGSPHPTLCISTRKPTVAKLQWHASRGRATLESRSEMLPILPRINLPFSVELSGNVIPTIVVHLDLQCFYASLIICLVFAIADCSPVLTSAIHTHNKKFTRGGIPSRNQHVACGDKQRVFL